MAGKPRGKSDIKSDKTPIVVHPPQKLGKSAGERRGSGEGEDRTPTSWWEGALRRLARLKW